MWRAFYQISWGVIILNGVVGTVLEIGLKVIYPPVIEWIVVFVPLCFFGYIAGYWSIEKVRGLRRSQRWHAFWRTFT